MGGDDVGDPVLWAYHQAVQWRLLAGVEDTELQQLISVARRRRFDRHEVVFHRDDPADSLHLIVKGRFAVRVTTPLGDTALLAVHGPGHTFGELALLSPGAARSATVAALEPAETMSIFRDDFAHLQARHPPVNNVLLAVIAEQVRRAKRADRRGSLPRRRHAPSGAGSTSLLGSTAATPCR